MNDCDHKTKGKYCCACRAGYVRRSDVDLWDPAQIERFIEWPALYDERGGEA